MDLEVIIADYFHSLFVIALLLLIVLTKLRINSINNSLATPDDSHGPYKLYSRKFLWLKQLFLLITITVLVIEIVLSISTIETIQLFIICSRALAIILLLTFDNINYLSMPEKQRPWIASYVLLLIDSVCVCLIESSSEAIIVSVTLSIATVAAFYCSFCTYYKLVIHRPTAEYTCGMWSYFSFSHVTEPLINLARVKGKLEFEDTPTFVDYDTASYNWDQFSKFMEMEKDNVSLLRVLQRVVWSEWLAQGVFQFFGSSVGFLAPLALQRVLIYVTDKSESGDNYGAVPLLPVAIGYAVAMLYILPALKGVFDGQNYIRGRHIGIRINASLISAVYNKSLRVDLTSSKESVGKLNNLISVDIRSIQEFCSYSHFIWATPFEMAIAMVLLFSVLGYAAWAGVFVMILALWIGMWIAKVLEAYQKQLLKEKDTRIGIINEVLNSMRIIKFFAWEDKFTDKIMNARQTELKSLRKYAVTNGMLYTMWEVVPALVAVVAFLFHAKALGKELTPSMGFTALTLFNLLRFPLTVFPDIINRYVQSKASLARIQSFLGTADVEGIKQLDGHLSNNSNNAGSKSNSDGSFNSDDILVSVQSNQRKASQEKFLRKIALINSATSSLQSKTQNDGKIPISEKVAKLLPGYVKVSNVTLAWNCTQHDDEETIVKQSKWYNRYLKCCRHHQYEPLADNDHGVDRMPEVYGLCCMRQSHNYKPVLAEKQFTKSFCSCFSKTHDDADEIGDRHTLDESLIGNHRRTVSQRGDIEMNDIENPVVERKVETCVILSGINAVAPPKSLTVIVGMTGAGKSTFLEGLLGECKIISGDRIINGEISYVSQSAWIQQATLRDNVLFGLPFDKKRYDQVLYACALESDLKLLPFGDMTEIGEKGVNLSGGQQQRVSLARAAYSYSDVILLDDPLSAVDAHVGEHIFRELVVGFLSDRTRLLVSHNLALTLPSADKVLCLDASKKTVIASCAPKDLPTVLKKHLRDDNNSESSVFFDGLIRICTDAEEGFQEKKQQEQTKSLDMNENSFHFDGKYDNCSYKSLSTMTNREQIAPSKKSVENVNNNNEDNKIISVETKSVGKVALQVYWFYGVAAGGTVAVLAIFIACIWIAASWLYQTYALGVWLSDVEEKSPEQTESLNIYLLSVLSLIVANVFRLMCSLLSSLRVSKTAHYALIRSVVRAPCSWYDATPIGRIINRFSQDISTVDSDIMNHILGFMDCFMGTIQTFVVIAWIIPFLLLPLFPIMTFTAWIAHQYVTVSRELKRLESIKKSPVFVTFSETLTGLAVIRAFRKEDKFFDICRQRIDEMNRCHLYLWMCNRWLNMRMQLMGAFVAGSAAAAVVINAEIVGGTAAGVILIYCLSFCDDLTFLARTHAEVQMDMNSVERIQEYSSLPEEKYDDAGKSDVFIAANWPVKGNVEFKDICLKYRTNSVPVLRNISFRIPGQKKVGVVGRTGAGKSSLIAALFRLVEPYQGQLLIDGIDVLGIPLNKLRESLSIVPQVLLFICSRSTIC